MPQIANTMNDRVSIRINHEDKALLMKAVSLSHTNITEFILQQILPKAKEIVTEYEQNQFSNRDISQIMSLLDNPPQPNARLLKAAEQAKAYYS